MKKILIGLLAAAMAPAALAQVPPDQTAEFEYLRWAEPSSNRYDVACSIDRTGATPLEIYSVVMRDANNTSMMALAYGIGAVQEAYIEALAAYTTLPPAEQTADALRNLIAARLGR